MHKSRYLQACGYSLTPDEAGVEQFISAELGLTNLVNSARASFNEVHFYAVSAISSNKAGLRRLFSDLLNQRNVSL